MSSLFIQKFLPTLTIIHVDGPKPLCWPVPEPRIWVRFKGSWGFRAMLHTIPMHQKYFLVVRPLPLANCNRWMGTDFLHIFSPHFSDMLFRCFLTKIWWILCRLKNWGLQWPLRVFFQAQKPSFYNIERPDQLQVEG